MHCQIACRINTQNVIVIQEKLQQTKFSSLLFSGLMSLHQDVPHGLDVLVTIISPVPCFVSTCVVVIMPPSSTKSNSGVTGTAVESIVTKDTDSYFTIRRHVTFDVKSFLVTVGLQGGLRTNQWLPRATTKWGAAVLPISDQRVQGVRLPVDYNKLGLIVDLHAEADLREGCVPVGA